MTESTWAAIVVNYEAGDLLIDCVRSILADESAGKPELVVVDNGSGDNSVASLRASLPGVQIVDAPGNVGYARAANLGIAATRSAVVAVLNADLTLGPGTAAALLERFDRDATLGACGPRIRNLDGTDYPSARRVPSTVEAVGHGALGLWWPTNPFTVRYRELNADPTAPRLVDWLSGSAIWLRRTALVEVGGWDERYFMYMEDLDLCWRLDRAGWAVAYEPGGSVEHVQGAMTRRHPYRMLLEHHRSAWRFARRRFTGARAALLPIAAVYLWLRGAMAMLEHAWRASHAGRARD